MSATRSSIKIIIISLKEKLKKAIDDHIIKNAAAYLEDIEKLICNIDKEPEELLASKLKDIQLLVKHADSIREIKQEIPGYQENVSKLKQEVNRLNRLRQTLERDFPVKKGGVDYEEDELFDAFYVDIDRLSKQAAMYFTKGFFQDIIEREFDFKNLNNSNWRNPDYLNGVKEKLKNLTATIPCAIIKLSEYTEKEIKDVLIEGILKNKKQLHDNILTLVNLKNDELKNIVEDCREKHNQLVGIELDSKSLKELKLLSNEIISQNNQVTITLETINARQIQLESNKSRSDNNKKRLREYCDGLKKMVNEELSFLLQRIESNAKITESCVNVGTNLKIAYDITCDVTHLSFSDERSALSTKIEKYQKLIEKLEAAYNVIIKESIFADFPDEDIKNIFNEDHLSGIKEQISKANTIVESQNQLLNKASFYLIDAKNILSNRAEASQYAVTINKHEENIQKLEKNIKTKYTETKNLFVNLKESVQGKQCEFQQCVRTYKVNLTKQLEKDEKSWSSRFLTWISNIVPFIKNTKRDLLKAEQDSVNSLEDNYNSHCNALCQVLDQPDTSITNVIKESKKMLDTIKNQFDDSYNQLIEVSKVVQAHCEKYQALKEETTRAIQAAINMKNETISKEDEYLKKLHTYIDKVGNLLVKLQPNDKKPSSAYKPSNNITIIRSEPISSSYAHKASPLSQFFFNNILNTILLTKEMLNSTPARSTSSKPQ